MQAARGGTLVETLVALLLLEIALLALVPLFIYAAKATVSGGEMGSVGALAVERMERLRSESFDSLPAGGSLATDEPGYSEQPRAGYVVRWRVTDNAIPATEKTIEVRALSEARTVGPPRQVTLTTVRAQ